MQITIGNTRNPKNSLTKSFNDRRVLEGNLPDDCNILNPTIEINYYNGVENTNYAYIPAFDRYYFIEEKTLSGQTVKLQLRCDVLMSFKSDILASSGTATRSNMRNDNIRDNLILDIPKQNIQYRKLSGEITGETYVMIVGG